MEQLEVLIFVERIFVMFAQVAQVVGVVKIFEPSRVASELFVIGADGARILHAAMNHFRFLVALHLILDRDNNPDSEYGHQSDHEKQREQDISLFPARAGCFSPSLSCTPLGCDLLHDGFPCVRGMLCGGPLPTTS